MRVLIISRVILFFFFDRQASWNSEIYLSLILFRQLHILKKKNLNMFPYHLFCLGLLTSCFLPRRCASFITYANARAQMFIWYSLVIPFQRRISLGFQFRSTNEPMNSSVRSVIWYPDMCNPLHSMHLCPFSIVAVLWIFLTPSADI